MVAARREVGGTRVRQVKGPERALRTVESHSTPETDIPLYVQYPKLKKIQVFS